MNSECESLNMFIMLEPAAVVRVCSGEVSSSLRVPVPLPASRPLKLGRVG